MLSPETQPEILGSKIDREGFEAVMSWIKNDPDNAKMNYESSVIFNDILREMVELRIHGSDPSLVENAPALASELLNSIESISEEKSLQGGAVRLAMDGKIESTKVALDFLDIENKNKYTILSLAYFSSSVQFGAFGKRGINIIHISDNQNMIVSGSKTGFRDLRDIEVYDAMDKINAGFILLSQAVVTHSISK